MSRKHLVRALGSYPDREEFQVGRVIVWIMISARDRREDCLVLGDRLFEIVWNELPAVISVAERELRTLFPEFWRELDQSPSAHEPLAVLGIWLHPDTGKAAFHISMSEMPDDQGILVVREPAGSLLIQRSS